MKQIPESHSDILDKPAFAHLSTLMPDGSPQASAVWVDTDGGAIVINSAEGRLKDRNIRRDPRVAVSVTDPENPYRSLMIRGRVAKITNDGADQHIDLTLLENCNAASPRYWSGSRMFGPGRQAMVLGA